MLPLCYGSVYKTPSDYPPALDESLISDTTYPNLNSASYMFLPLENDIKMYNAWESISLNEKNNVIIGTNKLYGREWKGSIWGFENCKEINPDKTTFKMNTSGIIVKLSYISKDVFALAMTSGVLQLWVIRADDDPSSESCKVCLVGAKSEYQKPISAMEVMKLNSEKLITGGKDGTLKIWSTESDNLESTQTYRFGHRDVITGVTGSLIDESILATCSFDKSALLWDVRLPRPATAIYDAHNVRFTDIIWYAQNSINIINLCDESGNIYEVDYRVPNMFLKSTNVFDRPIKTIIQNETTDYVALIANSNVLKVIESNTHKLIYEDANGQDFLRDAVWCSEKELLTVGFEGKMQIHNLA